MTMNAAQSTSHLVPSSRLAADAAPPASPEQIVDALHGVFGRVPGARAIHAKGIVLEGTFSPSPSASTLSKAPHLQHTEVPVVVRFSNFSGDPGTADFEPTASPRGMALKFRLPDGTTSDIVAHSFNGFPTRNADEFRALFLALKASPPGAPSPTPLETFFETHPAAQAFLSAPNPPPVDYGSLPYYGVNSFKFVNSTGNECFGRYRIDPAEGAQFLSHEQTLRKADSYLAAATRARVETAPIVFRLAVQLADVADVIDDPSVAWPETRRSVELGVLRVTRVVEDDEATGRDLSFDPAALPAGIEPADPMVRARSASYLISQRQRSMSVATYQSITQHELQQVARANETGRTPIVFVHGLWLMPNSWKPWADMFESLGFVALTPGWPDDPDTVEEANAHPEIFAHKNVGQVVDHFAAIVGALKHKPIVVGHSFGGLVAQILAGRALSKVTVAIDPAPFRGVLPLPISSLKSAWPVLGKPANRNRAVPLTFDQFRFAFANAVSEEEAHRLYAAYAVPASGVPLFQAATANLNPWTEVRVDTENPQRGPLLIISGEKDNTVPPAVANAAFERQRRNPGVTELVELSGRGHSLTIDGGWPEVADAALRFVERFAHS
jgi:non-heme chloroperoxidase